MDRINNFLVGSRVFLDIHHINTGRGDTIFRVFSDGTTLLDDTSEEHKIQAKYGPYKAR